MPRCCSLRCFSSRTIPHKRRGLSGKPESVFLLIFPQRCCFHLVFHDARKWLCACGDGIDWGRPSHDMMCLVVTRSALFGRAEREVGERSLCGPGRRGGSKRGSEHHPPHELKPVLARGPPSSRECCSRKHPSLVAPCSLALGCACAGRKGCELHRSSQRMHVQTKGLRTALG